MSDQQIPPISRNTVDELVDLAAHVPTQADLADEREIGQAFTKLALTLRALCQSGRCYAVCMTHLETAQAWANKASAQKERR